MANQNLLSEDASIFTHQMNLGAEIGKKSATCNANEKSYSNTKGNQNLHIANCFAGFLYFESLLHTSKHSRLVLLKLFLELLCFNLLESHHAVCI